MEPIFITGCARSGTSLTAGIVNLCGAFGGSLAGPNGNNKRGMFENTEIRNTIVKPYFRRIGADPLGQNPLPDILKVLQSTKEPGFLENWRIRILRIMSNQGYRKGPWFYKGAKMCLHWPIWHYCFPDAIWIIVRRKDDDIINSCLKTGFMRAYQNSKGWQTWIDAHLVRFDEMISFGLNIYEIWPQDIVEGELCRIRDCVINHLGLEWREKEVLNFISPALWSNAKRRGNG